MEDTTFGAYLRGVRERRGMSLREAADLTGIAYSRLQELETNTSTKTRGPVSPTKKNLEALAKGYHLAIDQLYSLAHFSEYLREKSGLGPEELAVVDIFKRLSPAKRKIWLGLGEDLLTLPD